MNNQEHLSKEQQFTGSRFSTLSLAQAGMLAAVALILGFYVHFPLLPGAPWLEYDIADVPILLGAFMISPTAGLLILAAVSAVQAFMLGGNGFIGFIMHMAASGVLVLLPALLVRRFGDSNRVVIISLMIGGLAMVALMIPLNLIFTPILFGMTVEAVKRLILPVLLPFNLLKAALTGTIFFLLYRSLRNAINTKMG